MLPASVYLENPKSEYLIELQIISNNLVAHYCNLWEFVLIFFSLLKNRVLLPWEQLGRREENEPRIRLSKLLASQH